MKIINRSNAYNAFAVLILFLFSCSNSARNPHIRLSVPQGEIIIELYPEKAPLTVSNFLSYIDEGGFEKAVFYRTVTMDNQPDNEIMIEVIQGGIWFTDSLSMKESIEHETTDKTGIKHEDGTISMARNQPGSASSEFFICVGDQPSLDFGGKRNPDSQGFAAFGKVIKGMDIVRAIHKSPCEGQILNPFIEILSIERSAR